MANVHVKIFAKTNEHRKLAQIQADFRKRFGRDIRIDVEYCYHILANQVDFYEKNEAILVKLLSHSPFEEAASLNSRFKDKTDGKIIEIGPRTAVKTAKCTNITNVFNTAGITNFDRVEQSFRYFVDKNVDEQQFFEIAADKMTEMLYGGDDERIFEKEGKEKKADFFEIDIIADRNNLMKANVDLGLALDQADLDFYYNFFVNEMKRNPTDVELFDLAQSDSEHSRHWFFRGNLVIDGEKMEKSLMDRIRDTLKHSNPNSLIAFCDNSSSIRGFEKVRRIRPATPETHSPYRFVDEIPLHLIYSAETHNFPTAVCPFQGATTGTGGRIRDIHATGRGAYEIAGVAGYSFGNLNIPGYIQPWENDLNFVYPTSLSEPLKIAIEASNGASDYGNKFGEPVICGFARSFGQRLENGERIEYLKPIMFSGGIGSIDDDELQKQPCEVGYHVAKIGGPVYRIGVGGGAASSVQVQGKRDDDLDFAAVQRGDAEMGAKLHRVVRGCAERADGNPLKSIHDQGAGGNGNVIKELVEGHGIRVKSNEFKLADESISLRELWTAEYQENDAALVDPNLIEAIQKIGRREKCDITLIGQVTEEQRVVLEPFTTSSQVLPVNLDTRKLAEREKKTFHLDTKSISFKPCQFPAEMTIRDALSRVLRLPSVASKRYLTSKVDRSVTGLIAQQQCVGPLHTPLADVGVVALSHFETVGGAVAIGEQPIKMLVDPEKGARMTLSETILNLIWAPITELKDTKMSGNWMWAAKCAGEGARLVAAVGALCDGLATLGCAIDGGKDSLSMAVTAANEIVKAPGTLVLSAYAPCTDVNRIVTPNLKPGDRNPIWFIKCGSKTWNRLGGSALAQVYSQIGNDVPDVENFEEISKTFEIVQELIKQSKILAGHDVSDGGLITTILEMAFAGNCSINIEIDSKQSDALEYLFAEEAGIVIQISGDVEAEVSQLFANSQIFATKIGESLDEFGPDATVKFTFNSHLLFDELLIDLREEWEEVGDRLGEYQTTKKCLNEAKKVRSTTRQISYDWNWSYEYSIDFLHSQQYFTTAPRIAILREEGSNGDREMAAAFTLAGFQTFDITMTDLFDGHSLDSYRGIAFVGGFSYADVLGSAKGWASEILLNEKVNGEFVRFRNRADTFSYGVCNGCQLMAHLGWITDDENSNDVSIFLDENDCGRFESFFGPVRIEPSASIMLSGMEGAILGLWSSHGEGNFTYRHPAVLQKLKANNQICVRFSDGVGRSAKDYNCDTLALPYPFNPNGSQDDVAAICSKDGRHLAMMPHADRSFLSWQWPDYPAEKMVKNSLAPWIKMFRNAYEWSIN